MELGSFFMQSKYATYMQLIDFANVCVHLTLRICVSTVDLANVSTVDFAKVYVLLTLQKRMSAINFAKACECY